LGGRLSFALVALFACAVVAVAYSVAKATGKATYLIANPDGLSADEHLYIGLLSQDLVDGGIAPIALRVP
jgi:hypothetical protein